MVKRVVNSQSAINLYSTSAKSVTNALIIYLPIIGRNLHIFPCRRVISFHFFNLLSHFFKDLQAILKVFKVNFVVFMYRLSVPQILMHEELHLFLNLSEKLRYVSLNNLIPKFVAFYLSFYTYNNDVIVGIALPISSSISWVQSSQNFLSSDILSMGNVAYRTNFWAWCHLAQSVSI